MNSTLLSTSLGLSSLVTQSTSTAIHEKLMIFESSHPMVSSDATLVRKGIHGVARNASPKRKDVVILAKGRKTAIRPRRKHIDASSSKSRDSLSLSTSSSPSRRSVSRRVTNEGMMDHSLRSSSFPLQPLPGAAAATGYLQGAMWWESTTDQLSEYDVIVDHRTNDDEKNVPTNQLYEQLLQAMLPLYIRAVQEGRHEGLHVIIQSIIASVKEKGGRFLRSAAADPTSLPTERHYWIPVSLMITRLYVYAGLAASSRREGSTTAPEQDIEQVPNAPMMTPMEDATIGSDRHELIPNDDADSIVMMAWDGDSPKTPVIVENDDDEDAQTCTSSTCNSSYHQDDMMKLLCLAAESSSNIEM